MSDRFPDIAALERAFDANERDARALVAGLSEALGTWRAEPGSWSVAECLDHLAAGNRAYLRAMEPVAQRALACGRRRRGPAVPGWIGRWFVSTFEPPVRRRYKLKAPRTIRPRSSPALHDAAAQFRGSQEELRAFLRGYAEIDLAFGALSQSIRRRVPIQSRHWTSCPRRARAASSLAGVARPRSRRTGDTRCAIGHLTRTLGSNLDANQARPRTSRQRRYRGTSLA